jgi:Protein of unknown function (DUF3551)
MRMIVFVLSFVGCLVMLSAEPAEARGRAFCMRGHGARDCSFDTMEQCRASASGRTGMHCMANPFPDRPAR